MMWSSQKINTKLKKFKSLKQTIEKNQQTKSQTKPNQTSNQKYPTPPPPKKNPKNQKTKNEIGNYVIILE